MYPILFKIGDAIFFSYGVFLALAFILVIYLCEKEAQKQNIHPVFILNLGLLSTISAFFGAKLFYVIFYQKAFVKLPREIFDIKSSGFVYYGGFILTSLMVLLFCLANKLPFWKINDIIAANLPLGYVIGRIGCFLNGCCFGKITNVPWAVKFPRWIDANGRLVGSDAFLRHFEQGLVKFSDTHSLSVHPTQLYSAAYGLIIFIILRQLLRHKKFDGQILFSYFILYGFLRFIVEFYRADNPAFLFGLTNAQIISIILFIIGSYTTYKKFLKRSLEEKKNVK